MSDNGLFETMIKAEQGDAYYQYLLGMSYYVGVNVEQSIDEAIRWLQRAAEQGFSAAQTTLGDIYSSGERTFHAPGIPYLPGVPCNYEEAFKWYGKAAAQGDSRGQYHIGECYEKGQGISQNYEEAIKWYRRAAENGEENAKKKLAELLDIESGEPAKLDKQPSPEKSKSKKPSKIAKVLKGIIIALCVAYAVFFIVKWAL